MISEGLQKHSPGSHRRVAGCSLCFGFGYHETIKIFTIFRNTQNTQVLSFTCSFLTDFTGSRGRRMASIQGRTVVARHQFGSYVLLCLCFLLFCDQIYKLYSGLYVEQSIATMSPLCLADLRCAFLRLSCSFYYEWLVLPRSKVFFSQPSSHLRPHCNLPQDQIVLKCLEMRYGTCCGVRMVD